MRSVISKLTALASRLSERRSLARLFDERYYLSNYPEVRDLHMRPIDHFMAIGWREGKNPSNDFDVNYYLTSNPDVKQAHINPLLHYVRHGKKEGRQARLLPDIQQQPHSVAYSSQEMEAVEPLFDPGYYLTMYEDIRRAGIDPLQHYMYVGWREFRNPSANFNTATYLQINKDVRDAGINPLLHYAQSGRHEDRIIKLNCLEELRVLHHKYNNHASAETRTSIDIDPIGKLAGLLDNLTGLKPVVALSHDDYMSNTGGVQMFIREEEEKYRSKGYAYIHLSPLHTGGSPSLVKDYVRVIVNGDRLGVYLFAEVIRLIEGLGEKTETGITLIIHSLINFDEEHVLRAILLIKWAGKYCWIHDYSLLCSEFNLLRNGVQWCGLPSKDSVACYTCTGSESRENKERLLNLLTDNDFVFVAPSDTAKAVMERSKLIPAGRMQVVNHVTLTRNGAQRRKLRDGADRIRVAYCGHPVFHKGWGVFQQIVEFTAQSNQYRFYHLGVHDTQLHCTEFVKTNTTAESRDAMTKAIRDNDIDVVLIPAQWQETFCYVAYEALLGGALVFTTEASGNVMQLSRSSGEVVVFRSNQDLIEAFTTGRAVEIASQAFERGLPAYEAQYSGTTAALEASHAS